MIFKVSVLGSEDDAHKTCVNVCCSVEYHRLCVSPRRTNFGHILPKR